MRSGFYRSRRGFYDEEWSADTLKRHYVPQGVVICVDEVPNLEFWEPIHMWGGNDSVIARGEDQKS